MMKIIDRDIQFYEGDVEHAKMQLRLASPSQEAYWGARRDAASKVVNALKAYRAALCMAEEVA